MGSTVPPLSITRRDGLATLSIAFGMKIFDTHTHVFPDKIARQAVAHLRELSNGIPAYTDGTAADLAVKAAEAGYDGWMNCPVVTRAGQAHSVNAWAAALNQWPHLSLGGVHPDDEDKPAILRQILDSGLHGLKLHPEYQEFCLDDSRMDGVWDFCEEHELPVLIHAGEDIGFRPPYHSDPKAFVELARRHPKLTIVAAHTGGWKLWDELENLLPASRNLFIETSFSMPFMKERGQMLRIIRKIGVSQVLFGTDSPWGELRQSIQDIATCGLEPKELEAVFWGNARSVWKRCPELQA